jgi:hypothetical protein
MSGSHVVPVQLPDGSEVDVPVSFIEVASDSPTVRTGSIGSIGTMSVLVHADTWALERRLEALMATLDGSDREAAGAMLAECASVRDAS